MKISIREVAIGILALSLAYVSFAELPRRSSELSHEEKLERLRKRAELYWDLCVKSNWEQQYELFFKDYVKGETKSTWLSQKGAIEYPKAKVMDVAITGENTGEEIVDFTFKVVHPMFTIRLKEPYIKEAKGVKSPWEFVNGEWYRKIVPLGGETPAGMGFQQPNPSGGPRKALPVNGGTSAPTPGDKTSGGGDKK